MKHDRWENASMLKKMIIVIAILLLAICVYVCCQIQELRVGAVGQCSHDALSLWAANGASFKWQRPRVSKVEVWVDGARSDAEVKIVAFDSKLGWSEAANFSVPESANSAQVRAHVSSGFRRYLVTQTWVKHPDEPKGPYRPREWTVENVSIQPASD
jgi:hypothetical protein